MQADPSGRNLDLGEIRIRSPLEPLAQFWRETELATIGQFDLHPPGLAIETRGHDHGFALALDLGPPPGSGNLGEDFLIAH